ncbi:MAG: hypothetical protein JJ863_30265 [Deltaproteobacteria bacterium]|nr:hypothetical protein [Deltaproteobacteria bacterium]
MNPVASLARTFHCDADTLFAALERRDEWWGEGAGGAVAKHVPGERLTLTIDVRGTATRAMLVLSPGGPSPMDGTQLQVLHTRFEDDADRDAHAALWDARLERLASCL